MTDALQIISVKPAENGTAKVTLSPTDEDGDVLTVEQLTTPQWQLMKKDGTIINNRSFALCSLSALIFRLSGDDLAFFGGTDSGWRYLALKATYDSNLGSDNSLNAECKFQVQNLLSQTDA